jgi:hypothetical protein
MRECGMPVRRKPKLAFHHPYKPYLTKARLLGNFGRIGKHNGVYRYQRSSFSNARSEEISLGVSLNRDAVTSFPAKHVRANWPSTARVALCVAVCEPPSRPRREPGCLDSERNRHLQSGERYRADRNASCQLRASSYRSSGGLLPAVRAHTASRS